MASKSSLAKKAARQLEAAEKTASSTAEILKIVKRLEKKIKALDETIKA